MILAAILTVAALALVAAVASVLSGAVMALLDRFGAGLTATARARSLFGLALFPAAAAVTVVGIALAPSVGIGVDHCSAHHWHHAHLCFTHAPAELGILPALVAGALGARLLFRLASTAQLVLRARRAVRALGAQRGSPRDAVVIDDDEPLAFVLGFLRPRVFVARGLLDRSGDAQLSAVLAHEHAHRTRRDPLRRLIAGLAVSMHLPFIGRAIERRLALANEMAADERAARVVGDPTLVAEVLVRHARLSALAPSGAMALGETNVAARVTALLDDRRRLDAPSLRWLAAAAAVLAAFAIALGDPLHHTLEHVLGLLHF